MSVRICTVTVALVLLSLACGPAGRPDQGDASDQAPRYGGVLNIHVYEDPYDWDLSYQGKSHPGGEGQEFAYDSLLAYQVAPDIPYDELVLRPALAERWEVSADSRTFTLFLRKGVRFANLPPVNGRELSSADAQWSYEYWARSGRFKDQKLAPGQFEWMLEGMESIDTPDGHTLSVRFKEPFSPFLNYAASGRLPVVPREIYELDGHLKDRIAGTGPFQLAASDSQKGTRWVWKKNASYWDEGKPYIEEVRWLVLPQDAAALAAFQVKQVDYLGVSLFRTDSLGEFVKQNPNAVVFKNHSLAGHLYMQTQRPPLNDIRVRKAIGLAIDRDELARLLQGEAAPWAPPTAPMGLFTDQEARRLMKHDPAEARRLLAEAGHSSLPLTWEYSTTGGDANLIAIQLLQAQLKRVGIEVTLKALEQAEYSASRKRQDYTIQYNPGRCGEDGDPDAMLFACYHSKSKANYGAVNDPDLDAMLLTQRREADPEKRKELWRSVVTRVNDMVWAISFYYKPEWRAWQPYLKNYTPKGTYGWPLQASWLDK